MKALIAALSLATTLAEVQRLHNPSHPTPQGNRVNEQVTSGESAESVVIL